LGRPVVEDVRLDERDRLRVDGNGPDRGLGLRRAIADVDEPTLDVEVLGPLQGPELVEPEAGREGEDDDRDVTLAAPGGGRGADDERDVDVGEGLATRVRLWRDLHPIQGVGCE